jgi:16S rRNA (guanine(966)-N(2))-methyltransferase RsmD
LRVIAGSAKGTKLAAPEGLASRPVLDRVKESWFASIAERLDGARVLDLYAGVGSLGIEALSRGARECVFVDRDAACVRLLEQHLARARLSDRAVVRHCLAELAVCDQLRADETFNLIFVDPPFADSARPDYIVADPAFAPLGGLAAEGALVMLRREREGRPRGGKGRKGRREADRPPPAPVGLVFVKGRRWGRNEVLFYERSHADIVGG